MKFSWFQLTPLPAIEYIAQTPCRVLMHVTIHTFGVHAGSCLSSFHGSLEEHTCRVCLLIVPLVRSYRARRSEKEHLDRNRKASVQRQHDNKQYFARLVLGGRKNRVQVPEQEGGGERQAEGDKRVVQNLPWLAQHNTPSMI